MDNKKIGKLIANLRNSKGLTQQQLGDKVGVGFRAVSKWERGNNLPDIGNMKELSKILGITLDELLAGELKKEKKRKNKKRISTKIKITISIITLIIIIFTSLIIYHNNETYVYNMASANEAEYIVEGQITIQGRKMYIIMNKLLFVDEKLSSTKINNYEYKIFSNDDYLFGYGYLSDLSMAEEGQTIKQIAEEFRINYTVETDLTREEIIDNNINLVINFIDSKGQTIQKEVKIILYTNEK